MWGKQVLLIALTLAIVSACSSTGGTVQGPAKDVNAVAIPKKEPVQLTFYNVDKHPEERFMVEYGNKLKEKFPHVTVKYLTGDLQALVTSGESIDIILSSIGLTHNSVIKFNFQQNISELIKQYRYDTTKLEPSTVAIQKDLANGGIYGLPVRTSTYTLFYNRDIFDKFGVPYLKEGMSWDELYEVSRKMTRNDSGMQYYGFIMSPGHMLSHNQLSLQAVDSKTNEILFTGDKYVGLVQNFIRFFKVPGMESYKDAMSTNTAIHKEAFTKTQNAAMFAFSTVWRDKEMSDVNWDVVPLPTFNEAKGIGPQSYPSYFYLTNQSKHKEQAFEVMAYFTTDEFQLFTSRMGLPPIVNSPQVLAEFGKGSEYAEFYKGKNIKALVPTNYAKAIPKTDITGIAEKQVVAAMKNTIFNNTDINTALRDASEAAKKEIEVLKK
jgi:multiple sugar transport system substrate-binding protein